MALYFQIVGVGVHVIIAAAAIVYFGGLALLKSLFGGR